MVEQKERMRITQSGKNCAMNCAIQGVHLIWKQKIWLAICEFLFCDFPANQFNFKFCHSISTFCSQFQLSALFGINWHALSQSAWWNFCMYIIIEVMTELTKKLTFRLTRVTWDILWRTVQFLTSVWKGSCVFHLRTVFSAILAGWPTEYQGSDF